MTKKVEEKPKRPRGYLSPETIGDLNQLRREWRDLVKHSATRRIFPSYETNYYRIKIWMLSKKNAEKAKRTAQEIGFTDIQVVPDINDVSQKLTGHYSCVVKVPYELPTEATIPKDKPENPPEKVGFLEDHRKENPGLHMLYVKWAAKHLHIIDQMITDLYNLHNLNMFGPAEALIGAKDKLIKENAAYADADEILKEIFRKETE